MLMVLSVERNVVCLPKVKPVRVSSSLSSGSPAVRAGTTTGRLQTLSAMQFSTAPEKWPKGGGGGDRGQNLPKKRAEEGDKHTGCE